MAFYFFAISFFQDQVAPAQRLNALLAMLGACLVRAWILLVVSSRADRAGICRSRSGSFIPSTHWMRSGRARSLFQVSFQYPFRVKVAAGRGFGVGATPETLKRSVERADVRAHTRTRAHAHTRASGHLCCFTVSGVADV